MLIIVKSHVGTPMNKTRIFSVFVCIAYFLLFKGSGVIDNFFVFPY